MDYIYKDYKLDLSDNPFRVEYSDVDYIANKTTLDNTLKSIFASVGLILDTTNIHNAKIAYQYTNEGPRLEWKGDLYLQKSQPGVDGLKWKNKQANYQSTAQIDNNLIYLNNGSGTYTDADWRWLNLFEISEIINPAYCYFWDGGQINNKVVASFLGVSDDYVAKNRAAINVRENDVKDYKLTTRDFAEVSKTTYSRFGAQNKALEYLTFSSADIFDTVYDNSSKVKSGQHGVQKDKASTNQEKIEYWATAGNNYIRVIVNDFNKMTGSFEPTINWISPTEVYINNSLFHVKRNSRITIFRRSADKPQLNVGISYGPNADEEVDTLLQEYLDMDVSAGTTSAKVELKQQRINSYVPECAIVLNSIIIEEKSKTYDSNWSNWINVSQTSWENTAMWKTISLPPQYSSPVSDKTVSADNYNYAKIIGWNNRIIFNFALMCKTFTFLDEAYNNSYKVYQTSTSYECAAKKLETWQSRKAWAFLGFNFNFPDGTIDTNYYKYCRILSPIFYWDNTESARICYQWTERRTERIPILLRRWNGAYYEGATYYSQYPTSGMQIVDFDGEAVGDSVLPPNNTGYTPAAFYREDTGNKAGLDMCITAINTPNTYVYAVIITQDD